MGCSLLDLLAGPVQAQAGRVSEGFYLGCPLGVDEQRREVALLPLHRQVGRGAVRWWQLFARSVLLVLIVLLFDQFCVRQFAILLLRWKSIRAVTYDDEVWQLLGLVAHGLLA